MQIFTRPRAASQTISRLSTELPAMWPRVKHWARAKARRAHPFMLICALFFAAFATTIVLRLMIFLAYVAVHQALWTKSSSVLKEMRHET